MNFKDNKAIYLQIADRIGDQILSGKLMPEGKVPSVRELAAEDRKTIAERCRAHALQHFSKQERYQDYIRLYESLTAR